MLKYCKTILKIVSFDKHLFKKELKKAIGWLNHSEKIILKTWCLTYMSKYKETIIKSFQDLI